jgi:hypothetical protein
MMQAEPYGHLAVNGNAMTEEQGARLIGVDVDTYKGYINQLEAAGISSRNESGMLFSRRLVRDYEAFMRASGFGRLGGGNPALKSKTKKEARSQKPEAKGSIKGGIKGALKVSNIPETLEVATIYAESIGLSKVEAEAFFDHFTANGWKVGGKSPMRDWKAALRTWKRNNSPGGQFFKSPERPLRFNERRVEPARGPRKVVRLESPEKARIAAMFASPAGIDAVLSRRAEILAEVEKAGSQQPESDVDEIIRIAGGVK